MIERLYIGSYSNSIKIVDFNRNRLEIIKEVEGICNPSYLCVNQDILYAVSETQVGEIGTFRITRNNLEKIDLKIINQSTPCYIAVNSDKKKLLVANYGAGSVILYALNENGLIEKEINCRSYPNANMHFANFIGNNIYAIDLSNDTIYQYNQELQEDSKIELEKGVGPRHLEVSKNKKTIYVATEVSNQILVYHKEQNNFELKQKVSTLIEPSEKSYVGAIKKSKDDRNIYVTNRGDNSISVFSIQKSKIELIQKISSYGNFPRDILLNTNEEYLLVANQKSDNIVMYKRNKDTGILSIVQNAELKIDKPSCIVRSSYEV